MKKFDRLPPQQRREEIQSAALRLFNEKGFSATTMENIVEQVSLSKGGVYRIYPSTTAILKDLMLAGMQLRNAYYADAVRREKEAGRPLTLRFLVGMIVDSLLLYPEFSSVYVEFLWEKQRSPELESLYQQICTTTVTATRELIRQFGAENLLLADETVLARLTELMNASIMSLRVLGLEDSFAHRRESIVEAITHILQN